MERRIVYTEGMEWNCVRRYCKIRTNKVKHKLNNVQAEFSEDNTSSSAGRNVLFREFLKSKRAFIKVLFLVRARHLKYFTLCVICYLAMIWKYTAILADVTLLPTPPPRNKKAYKLLMFLQQSYLRKIYVRYNGWNIN